MRLIGTCSEVHVGRYLSNTSPIENYLKQGDALGSIINKPGRNRN
jgi:hypothetical protein